MTKIIAVTNQKGGVGKTTTSIQLGDLLPMLHNKKTLSIDFDPQHTLTNAMNIQMARATPTVYEFVTEGIDARIQISDMLDFIPATTSLSNLTKFSDITATEMLKDALSDIQHEYDVILIDCPPAINELAHNTYTAADVLIVPVNPGEYSIDGLTLLKKEVDTIKRLFNPDLKILGILLINVDKRSIAERQLISDIDECCEILNTKRYGSIVYHSTVINDAQKYKKTLREFKKNSKAYRSFESFINEVAGDLNE